MKVKLYFLKNMLQLGLYPLNHDKISLMCSRFIFIRKLYFNTFGFTFMQQKKFEDFAFYSYIKGILY